MSLTHAIKWSFLSEFASKAIQPIVFIILARLLTPEDFGVMSAALMVIGFSQIFWEAGMGKAVIQRQTDVEDAANAAFWINIGLAVVVAGLLFASAEKIADTFFHDGRVKAVLQVMTIQVLLGAVSAIHIAILQKEMGFKKLFWVRFATVTLPGLASIPLAWYGMDYWALVAGTLIGQTAQVIILWQLSRWRPRWAFQIAVAKEIGRFGAWVAASGLLAWFYVWADALIVGMYLGSHDLGLYRTGNQLAIMIFALLFGPVIPVLYSHLSRMNQDKERLSMAAERLIKALTLIAIPIALIIFSLATPIADALFGEKWKGIGFVIGVMALMHGFSWTIGMNGEVYRAMGKPSYETIVTASSLVVFLLAYLVSIQYGFIVFVWTRFGLAFGGVMLHLIVVRIVLHIPIGSIIKYMLAITLICGMAVFMIQYLVVAHINGSWWKLLIGGSINFVVVAGVLLLSDRKGILKELAPMISGRSA